MISLLFIFGIAALAGLFGKTLPTGFLPDEDQGLRLRRRQLPMPARCSAPRISPARPKT